MTKDNEERTQRTNEVIAEMAAQLAREGTEALLQNSIRGRFTT